MGKTAKETEEKRANTEKTQTKKQGRAEGQEEEDALSREKKRRNQSRVAPVAMTPSSPARLVQAQHARDPGQPPLHPSRTSLSSLCRR